MYLIILVLVLFQVNHESNGRPVKNDNEQAKSVNSDSMRHYLTQYGYLPQSDIETGNLETKDQLKDAIRELQHFAHINETGEINQETLSLLQKPRCSVPDVLVNFRRKKRYVLHGRRWPSSTVTWSLAQHNSHLVRDQLRRELFLALRVWSKHSNLTFTEVQQDEADIVVSFHNGYHGDGYPFDGKGKILAHAFFPGSGRGGDVHFDNDEEWALALEKGALNKTSVFAVAAHEFGHSLGLAHSAINNSLMFPWYQGNIKNVHIYTLPDDDRFGIQQLYGAKVNQLWDNLPTLVTPKKEGNTESSSTVTSIKPTPNENPAVHSHRPSAYDKPDTCDTSYDAVSIIRKELFIFKGKFFWRINNDGLSNQYPAEINRLWTQLPKNLTKIDAVYERKDGFIVFFIGKQYWIFKANTMLSGYPKPLSNMGLPNDLNKLDGAMIWGRNGKTYFFSGTMYWRFNEFTQRVEHDYPRDMSLWRGVGYNIDAVFQGFNGKIYFFKGRRFWEFNDVKMQVTNPIPSLSSPFWMRCPARIKGQPENIESKAAPSSFRKIKISLYRSLFAYLDIIVVSTLVAGFAYILNI